MANAGTSGWTLFADALEEARSRGLVGKRRTGRPKRHLADVEMRQLKQAEQIRRRLDRLMQEGGPSWVPDAAFIEAHKAATQTISQVSRSLRLAKEAERKAQSKLSDDELDAVFAVELTRLAPTFDENTWRTIITAGMGADIAEAAIAVWKQRASDARAARQPTQFGEGNPGRAKL